MDFDGDSTPDLLSGSWPGELYFFKGLGKGKFARGETLKDKNGRVIKIESASTVFACDWRGSGKLDLLVGDIGGSAWLIPNEGTRGKPAYGKAVKLQANGKDIVAPHGDSHPVMADWDGGGKPGLVLGCGDGSVLWFKNVGTRTEPKLAAAQTLVAAPPQQNLNEAKPSKDTTRGTRAKVWVGDWDGDGRLDLVVGDFSMTVGEMPKLAEADKKLQKETEEKLTKLHKELEPYSRELTRIIDKGRKRGQTAVSDAEREQEQKELLALNKKYKDRLMERGKLYEILRKFQRPYNYHGHVWLFARQGAEKTSSR